jgi:ferredoxin-nitrate reductase
MKPASHTVFKSTCCYCGVGCGVKLRLGQQQELLLEGDESHPVNRGKLCSKGMNLHYTVNDRSDRLLYPQMRHNRHMPLQRTSWEEALERTAAVFRTFIEKYGPDSVGFYVSGQCLTEEYYVINKLVKGFIGTNNIDTNSRLCMSSAVAAYKMSLGEDAVPVCYDDIELSDCIFVTGANPAWCHPILWRRVEAHKLANPHVKLIVADPRKTDTASMADLHLQLNPGTDIVLHHAIGRLLIENGDIDPTFLSSHTEGVEDYRQRVFEKSVEEAALTCGIAVEDIRMAAELIGRSKAFMSMWTMGLNQSAVGVNKNLSLINLHLLTGQIGKPGAGPLSLTGQPNAMGGREVGGLANMLPAHRNLADPEHRAAVQAFWGGATIAPKPGLTATEMFEALESGKMKAIWIVCTNPLISLPDVRRAEAALKKAKFVVVQEISNKPETLAYADVILPAAGWAEKEGTMTNSERRITYLPKVVDAPGEALPDAEIICRFARKMGYHGFDFPDNASIFDEHVQLTAGTNMDATGIDYALLKAYRSVQWPLKAGELPAEGKRLFGDSQFYTASRKAILHPVPDDLTSERISPDFPFILTTGRVRDHWHTMTKTGKVNKLKQHTRNAFLEINPADAKRMHLADEELVTVRSARGELRVKLQYSDAIKPGVVFLPMHWGRILGSDLHRVNNVTSPLVDPISKEPDFKYCAVAVTRYRKPAQKILIIGAGAGAYGFVKTYRQLNTSDDIIVFSREDFPFYNRVMLPDYISGVQQWEELIKMNAAEEKASQISLLRGVSVTEINRTEKYVIDSRGEKTYWDQLIIATGSRASVPPRIPKLPGIFTMRSKTDADNFRKHLPENAQVVIAGGGLLGLELAVSLREIGVRVTVVQRISRLLNRQLDELGSALLAEVITEHGVDLLFNDELQSCFGQEKLTGIRLKSGKQLDCDALVFAIGTTPNIELAQEIGLDCRRGIVVNERMQTSDPDIFAVGEVAEFRGELFGITAAAEEQASIVANWLYGDIAARYDGSLSMNIIKIQGFDLCSMGITEKPDDPAFDEIVFIDRAKRYYKKCIVHQDRLVGAILIGDKAEMLEFKELIAGKIELSEKRMQLLRSGKKAEPVLGKLVCSCHQVGEGNLQQKIQEGCNTITALCAATGAATGCGSCRPQVQRIFDKLMGKSDEKTLIAITG